MQETTKKEKDMTNRDPETGRFTKASRTQKKACACAKAKTTKTAVNKAPVGAKTKATKATAKKAAPKAKKAVKKTTKKTK